MAGKLLKRDTRGGMSVPPFTADRKRKHFSITLTTSQLQIANHLREEQASCPLRFQRSILN